MSDTYGEDNNGKISIIVETPTHEEITYRLKYNTQFGRLIERHCDKIKLSPEQVNFIYQGNKIKRTDTPADLELENKSKISCLIVQTGGQFNFHKIYKIMKNKKNFLSLNKNFKIMNVMKKSVSRIDKKNQFIDVKQLQILKKSTCQENKQKTNVEKNEQNIVFDYEKIIDKQSKHYIYIRKGKIIENTPEFESIKRTIQFQYIQQMFCFLEFYKHCFEVFKNNLARIRIQFILRLLTNHQLNFINFFQFLELQQKDGQWSPCSNQLNIFLNQQAQKIQKQFRKYYKQKYKKEDKFKLSKIIKIQRFWKFKLQRIKFKKNIKKIMINFDKNYENIQNNRVDYNNCKVLYVILEQDNNVQFSKIFDLINKNISIMILTQKYVCEKIKNYYIQFLKNFQIQQVSSRLFFFNLEKEKSLQQLQINLTGKTYCSTKFESFIKKMKQNNYIVCWNLPHQDIWTKWASVKFQIQNIQNTENVYQNLMIQFIDHFNIKHDNKSIHKSFKSKNSESLVNFEQKKLNVNKLIKKKKNFKNDNNQISKVFFQRMLSHQQRLIQPDEFQNLPKIKSFFNKNNTQNNQEKFTSLTMGQIHTGYQNLTYICLDFLKNGILRVSDTIQLQTNNQQYFIKFQKQSKILKRQNKENNNMNTLESYFKQETDVEEYMNKDTIEIQLYQKEQMYCLSPQNIIQNKNFRIIPYAQNQRTLPMITFCVEINDQNKIKLAYSSQVKIYKQKILQSSFKKDLQILYFQIKDFIKKYINQYKIFECIKFYYIFDQRNKNFVFYDIEKRQRYNKITYNLQNLIIKDRHFVYFMDFSLQGLRYFNYENFFFTIKTEKLIFNFSNKEGILFFPNIKFEETKVVDILFVSENKQTISKLMIKFIKFIKDSYQKSTLIRMQNKSLDAIKIVQKKLQYSIQQNNLF